jgi:hypothetical protein
MTVVVKDTTANKCNEIEHDCMETMEARSLFFLGKIGSPAQQQAKCKLWRCKGARCRLNKQQNPVEGEARVA